MKKFISILCLIVLSAACVLSLGGCIFNNGSVDEVPGIYGLDKYYYSNDEMYNFGQDYEYYLLIIREESTTVVYKLVDGEEVSYEVTHELIMDSNDGNVVSSVRLNDFRNQSFTLLGDGSVSVIEQTEAISLSFRPKREDLIYRKSTLMRDGDSVKSVVTHLEFNKMYSRITDKKIERAKQKQADSRQERVTDGNTTDE